MTGAGEQASQATSGYGRGMLLLALANGAYIVTAYVVTMVTARILSPAEFGSFGVVMAWITVLTALLVKGLGTTIAREMAAGRVDRATAWHAGRRVGSRLALALALVGVLASPFAARLFGSSELSIPLAVGGLAALTFGVNAVLLAWPTGLRSYDRQAAAQVAYALARVSLVVGGAAAFGLHGAVVGYVLAPLVAAAPIVMQHPAPAAADALAPLRARMWRALLPVSLVSIAVTGYFVLDVFALSAVVGGSSAAVGSYVAHGTVAHVPFFLLQAASVTLVPALAATRSPGERAVVIRRTVTDALVLVAGPTLVLATSGDAVARVLFGHAYASPTPLVLPLALATGAVTLVANLVAVDVAVGRLRSSLAIALGGAVLLACSGWWAAGLGRGDAAGNVALATLVASTTAALMLAAHVRVRHGALLDSRRAAGGMLVAGAAALPPLLTDGDLTRMLVGIACGGAWLVLVVRLGLVDVRRASAPAPGRPLPVRAADPEHP